MDPIWVRIPNAVDGLIIVSGDTEARISCQDIQKTLFERVEILVLVDDYVIEGTQLIPSGVLGQVLVCLWHHFSDEHGAVLPKPPIDGMLKRKVFAICSEARMLADIARPPGDIRLKPPSPLMEIPEVTGNITEH